MSVTEANPASNLSGNRQATLGDSEVVIAVRGLTKVFKDFWGRPKARAVDGPKTPKPRSKINN